jgi:hypothetical protein
MYIEQAIIRKFKVSIYDSTNAEVQGESQPLLFHDFSVFFVDSPVSLHDYSVIFFGLPVEP